jgi:hypothetical protein
MNFNECPMSQSGLEPLKFKELRTRDTKHEYFILMKIWHVFEDFSLHFLCQSPRLVIYLFSILKKSLRSSAISSGEMTQMTSP